jgi:hypothetical protein
MGQSMNYSDKHVLAVISIIGSSLDMLGQSIWRMICWARSTGHCER